MSDKRKIKLLRGCVVNGEPQNKGAVVETNGADARYLIGAKSAEAADDKKDKAAGK